MKKSIKVTGEVSNQLIGKKVSIDKQDYLLIGRLNNEMRAIPLDEQNEMECIVLEEGGYEIGRLFM